MTKKSEYTLEHLVHKFAEHSIQAEEIHKEMIKSFKENNPGENLPSHLKDDFNLPKALNLICCELLKLREKIK